MVEEEEGAFEEFFEAEVFDDFDGSADPDDGVEAGDGFEEGDVADHDGGVDFELLDAEYGCEHEDSAEDTNDADDDEEGFD